MRQPSHSRHGLSPEEVERSRRENGSNQLSHKKRNSFFHQYLESFGDPIIKILLAALAINLIFLFRHANWFESAGIAVALFLATFVSTLSEYGSESAFIKLQEDAARISCRLRRTDGVKSHPIGEIVVGDLVLLQAGERVPADGLLISGRLTVDQSALNGESKEVTKHPGPGDFSSPDLREKNQLFRGSVVTAGDGVLLVQAVGDRTFYGALSLEMQEDTRESPLKAKLAHLARVISRFGYVAAALTGIADLLNSVVLNYGGHPELMLAELQNPGAMLSNILHAVTLAVTVLVVAVPEGLPMMITVVLSRNMFRMQKDHVMVRKLVGIETAGGINLLFTDKTGTLTRGKLAATCLITGDAVCYDDTRPLPRGTRLFDLLALSSVHNSESMLSDGEPLGGNATDRALLGFVLPLPTGLPVCQKRGGIPFDSARKFSTAAVTGAFQHTFVKGAPEKLLAHCRRYYTESGDIRPLTRVYPLNQKWQELTRDAVRVLVLAVSESPVTEQGDFDDLILIGLVGIRDEIRPEARRAVQQVQGAGVQVVMITGDNRDTAAAIAREAGLLTGSRRERILDSAELRRLSDGELARLLPDIRVVARALPTDKSRLVRIAQEQGLVVGMTGDGINDAPALKKADVGFAMGSGTEVAKEAGDIIILDNNFASIGKAILYGRTIFKSIQKFIVFQLTMNLCAVGVSIIGPFIGIDAPVTVIQMLWINIIMDTLAGLAFAGEAPLAEYMQEPPKNRLDPVMTGPMFGQVFCMGCFTVALCIFFLKTDWIRPLFRFDENPIYFMTAFFALFIFTGILNSFNARTNRLNLLAHLRENHSFITIMALVTAVQLALIYFGGSLFRTAGLRLSELLFVLALSLLVVPVDLLRKCYRKLK
ncbi:calcium-translocating P-type ATPase, PMCA-type [Feifania hominis]|uniref:calcium-translocating P-type ATPase, PMCA-type n=1 Tax=Feifania hominis TaxID=2763660 RepID=UPI002016695D